jgi:hypothetical protein
VGKANFKNRLPYKVKLQSKFPRLKAIVEREKLVQRSRKCLNICLDSGSGRVMLSQLNDIAILPPTYIYMYMYMWSS